MSDIVSVWHFASRWNQGVNIILDCEVSHAKVEDAMSVLRTLHHRTVDQGTDNANGLLVLDDDALALYAASFEVEQLQMVRVDGPIDRGDVLAMLGKSTSGESVMDAELRASASIEFRRDGPSIPRAGASTWWRRRSEPAWPATSRVLGTPGETCHDRHSAR